MNELDIRKKRALYRASHRGTKELDFMLGRFAEVHVPAMAPEALTAFEQFIALPDPDIDQFLRGKPAPEGIHALVEHIRTFLGLN
jgi:antitoxin CptB